VIQQQAAMGPKLNGLAHITFGAAGCSWTVEEGAADSAKPKYESRENHLRRALPQLAKA
jgi:hypothetical protein